MADLDRLLREQNPEPGQPRVPVPQYQKVDGVGFERVTGRHGGAHSVLLGPDGRPISSDNRLPVDTGLSGNLQIIADNQGRLYGRTASGSWLPVRVNSSGQLELAQNVVIDNVTVNVGAEVKVNNGENEPVPVQLSGNISEITTLVDAVAVTDANDFVDPQGVLIPSTLIGKYVEWDLFIVNTHDSAFRCSISPRTIYDSLPSVIMEDGSVKQYDTSISGGAQHLIPEKVNSIPLATIPAKAGDIKAIDPSPYKSYAGNLRLLLRSVTAPTEGAITVKLVGRLR